MRDDFPRYADALSQSSTEIGDGLPKFIPAGPGRRIAGFAVDMFLVISLLLILRVDNRDPSPYSLAMVVLVRTASRLALGRSPGEWIAGVILVSAPEVEQAEPGRRIRRWLSILVQPVPLLVFFTLAYLDTSTFGRNFTSALVVVVPVGIELFMMRRSSPWHRSYRDRLARCYVVRAR